MESLIDSQTFEQKPEGRVVHGVDTGKEHSKMDINMKSQKMAQRPMPLEWDEPEVLGQRGRQKQVASMITRLCKDLVPCAE